MAKGYIVMDMPESCKDCKFLHIYDAPYCVGCAIARMTHEGYDKPDWCPIKPQPERWERSHIMDEYEDGEADGRNELIDEMFGGEP